MKYGSICSGIEAASAAWESLGWSPSFFSEIEAFPCAALASHHPRVPNLGNLIYIRPTMKAINRRLRNGKPVSAGLAELWTKTIREIDLLVGGTPCQAFSVAGLRKSLDDHRGNLTLTFVELVHGLNPAAVVWENVPGVLNTKDNAFGCFLAGLVGEGEPLLCGDGSWPNAGMVIGPRRSAAWRVLDAQYFGLAQRRRRVFVVSFRTGDGINPGAVLFEPDSLPGNPPPSRETGTRVAASLTRGADSGGAGGYAGRRREDDFNIVTNALDAHMGMGGPDDNAAQANHLIPGFIPDVCPAIKARDCKGPSSDGDGDGAILVPMITHSLRADGFDASEDGTGRETPLVPVRFDWQAGGSHPTRPPTMNLQENLSGTLSITRTQAVAYRTSGNCGAMEQGDRTAALTTATDPSSNIIAYTIHGTDKTANVASEAMIAGSIRTRAPGSIENSGTTVALAFQTRIARNGRGQPKEIIDALTSCEGGTHADSKPHVAQGMMVRRLTPRECERLQGFPDNYTAIRFRRKPAQDGPRYRALGNSMAVPCMKWIGQRIELVQAAFAAREAVPA